MKDIQLNGDQRTWQALLDAENLSDFFNRAYAMTFFSVFSISSFEVFNVSSAFEICVFKRSISAYLARMKDIQLNGDQRTWQALLDAENLSDFFNRAYAMTVLQNFEREKIESFIEEASTCNFSSFCFKVVCVFSTFSCNAANFSFSIRCRKFIRFL
jgi:hypothetical protein